MINPQEEKTWFETTFFQLPDVAQRQMGAIVGSLIADAAANGMDLTELVPDENKQEKGIVDFDEHDKRFEKFLNSTEAPRLFSQDLIRSLNRSISLKVSSQQQQTSSIYQQEQTAIALYRTWSPASVSCIEVLQSIENSKSVDSFDWANDIDSGIGRVLSSSSSSSKKSNSSSNITGSSNKIYPMMPKEIINSMTPANSSLFPLLASIPVVALYPWARDSDVHLSSRTIFESIANHSSKLPFRVCPDLTMGTDEVERANNCSIEQVMQYYLAGSSTLLRYLQSNPDPTKNTILRLRGSKYGFDKLPEINEQETGKFGSLVFIRKESEVAFDQKPLPIVGVMNSAWNILRRDFYEAPSPKQFEKVVKRCVYESAKVHRVRNPSHLAAYVGACLGARYGVRNLPVDWMSECDRRSQGTLTQVVSTVVPMTQWVWNPPQ